MARSLAQSPVVLTRVAGPQALSWATGPHVSTLGHCPLSLTAQLARSCQCQEKPLRTATLWTLTPRSPAHGLWPSPTPELLFSGVLPWKWGGREWLPHWFSGRPEVAILTGLVLSPPSPPQYIPTCLDAWNSPARFFVSVPSQAWEALQTLHLLAVPNTSTRPRAPARAGSMVVTGG